MKKILRYIATPILLIISLLYITGLYNGYSDVNSITHQGGKPSWIFLRNDIKNLSTEKELAKSKGLSYHIINNNIFFPYYYGMVAGNNYAIEKWLNKNSYSQPTHTNALQPYAILSGHTKRILSISTPSTQNHIVATCGLDNTIIIWDIDKKSKLKTLTGHNHPVINVEIINDNRIISVGTDQTIRTWNIKTGKEESSILFNFKKVVSSAFSNNKKLLIHSTTDNQVFLTDLATGNQTKPIKNIKSAVEISFSSDDKNIITAHLDGTAKLWDLKTGKILKILKGHASLASSATISNNGKFALTGGQDQAVIYWAISSGKELNKFLGHQNPIARVKFSHDDKFAISASGAMFYNNGELKAGKDNSLRIWTLAKPENSYILSGHKAPTSKIIVSDDDKYIFSAGYDKNLIIWQVPKSI